jgi:glucose dehydrogenase
MDHRIYEGQRYSPLAQINRNDAENLELAYAVALGGSAGNEFTVATRSSRADSSTPPIPGACSTR